MRQINERKIVGDCRVTVEFAKFVFINTNV